LVTAALEHVAREERVTDGYPATASGNGATCGTATAELTSVERAADARYRLRSIREEIRDDLLALELRADALGKLCRETLGYRAPAPALCDGRSFAGAELPWTPHSHDPRNGWHDAACRDAADDSGLCPKCRVRERRWRDRNGLEPRAANAPAPAVQR
jgi:hypothetical protein